MSARLTAEQIADARAWAADKVSEGHHHNCLTNESEECNCYFGAPRYLAARYIAEAVSAAAAPENQT